MQKTKLAPRALLAIALAAITVSAVAMPMPTSSDVRIAIDRALNSPTLTVRFSGATVALVELRVNGESFATREVTGGKTTGETNFNLATKDLKDGDNDVEIRLYDRTGKLVGSDKVNVSTEQSNGGTVYVAAPKVGATVMGPTDIKVGFGTELKSSFVSFFVDNNFKSMTNYPPYTFAWDTTRETNGWHEIEAWAVDETSNTFKTKRIRVFVNNPGGRTDRPNVDLGGKPVKPAREYNVQGNEKGLRAVNVKGVKPVQGSTASLRPNTAPVMAGGNTLSNPVKANVLGGSQGLRPASDTAVVPTGVRSLTPTGTRNVVLPKPVAPKTVAPKAVAPKVSAPKVVKPSNGSVIEIRSTATVASNKVPTGAINAVTSTTSATMVSIVKGTRLPNFGKFSVVLNGNFVNFDVQPRVDNGVPMTPFRHLFEANGGKVKWEGLSKSVSAEGDGKLVFLQIGDPMAKVNEISIRMEVSPYLDGGRTIVPLSFLREALKVNVDYDKATGHVLITKQK